MTKFNPTIEFHGPVAIHNMVCPILHHTQEPAVFNCNGGYFKPSWKAQKMGYHTVYANNWLKRLIIKYIFK